MVLEVLTTATKLYKSNQSSISGVDLLAKQDETLCWTLISHAKVLILSSSEGSLVPFLEKLSAANRAVVWDVEDLDEEQAMVYLMENGVAKQG